LLARAERLRAKEEELNRKEAELLGREQIIASGGGGVNPKAPNWPRCRPLIYHNISGDMPTPETVRLVRMAYGSWFGMFLFVSSYKFIRMNLLLVVWFGILFVYLQYS